MKKSMRGPTDIVITAGPVTGPDRAMLLEVKNTSDPSYVAESIYRCFGYMHDFQDAGLFGETGPNCILLVNGLLPAPAQHQGLTVITSEMRAALVEALRINLTG